MTASTKTFAEKGVVTASGTQKLTALDQHLGQLKAIAVLPELAQEKFIVKKLSLVEFAGIKFKAEQWEETTQIFPTSEQIQACKTTRALMNIFAIPFTCYLKKYTNDIVANKIPITKPITAFLHYLHNIEDVPLIGDPEDQIQSYLLEIELMLHIQMIRIIESNEKDEIILTKVKMLLDQGARVDGATLRPAKYNHGVLASHEPLFSACEVKKTIVVKELLSANATLCLPDDPWLGKLFLVYAAKNWTSEIMQTLVNKVIETQDIDAIASSLTEAFSWLKVDYLRKDQAFKDNIQILKQALIKLAPQSSDSNNPIASDPLITKEAHVEFNKRVWSMRTQKLQPEHKSHILELKNNCGI